MPDDPKTAEELLDEIEAKIDEGFQNTIGLAEEAVKVDTLTTQEFVNKSMAVMYANTALTLELYRSTFNLLFRRKK